MLNKINSNFCFSHYWLKGFSLYSCDFSVYTQFPTCFPTWENEILATTYFKQARSHLPFSPPTIGFFSFLRQGILAYSSFTELSSRMPHPQVEENDSSSRGEATQGPLNAKLLISRVKLEIQSATLSRRPLPFWLICSLFGLCGRTELYI